MNELRRVREALGMTQEELRDRSGVGVATISRLENQHTKARTMTRKKLAFALGVPVSMIFPVRPRC